MYLIDMQLLQVTSNIINSYKQGQGLTTLARRYHTHYTKIRKILRDNNVEIKRPAECKTAKYANEIIKLYKEGIDGNKIGKRFKIAGQNIRKFLKQQGIKRRIRQEYCKQYLINIERFKDPSIEETSYWIGFIMADGHLRINSKTQTKLIKIKLQGGDIGHLWNFAKDLCTTKQPKAYDLKSSTGKTIHIAQILIMNQELYDLLISYGVKDFKKKGIINLPLSINMRHWLRGLIDGDGIISTIEKGKYLRIGFVSPHKNITQWVHDHINQIIEYPKINKISERKAWNSTKSIYYANWTGSFAVKIARYLYCDSTIYLQRRLDKVLPFILNR